MPSSSKHETCQEQRLANWFKATYACLYYSNLHKQTAIITGIYSDLLECTKTDLLHSLRDDSEWWDKFTKHCKSKSISDNVWTAADYVADTGACMFEFGRKKEGGDFCEWAQELRDLALEYYEREQADERRRKGLCEMR